MAVRASNLTFGNLGLKYRQWTFPCDEFRNAGRLNAPYVIEVEDQ